LVALRARPIYLSGRLRFVGGFCGNKIRLSKRIAAKVINTPTISFSPSIIIVSYCFVGGSTIELLNQFAARK
jgi:hypothetical protein